jgi:prophage DNA circulation protein
MVKDRLLIGTYRGITFRFREAGRTGGRKSIFHTYPNSDINLGEDFGRAPIDLTITIIVEGAGDSYYSQKNAVIKALEGEGASILQHPTYGQLKVQLDGNYSINERITNLGYAEITVSFKVVDNKKFLPADKNNNSFIENARNNINDALENTFMANLYLKAKEPYETIKQYTDEILDTANEITSSVFSDIESYNEYKAQIASFITYYPDKLVDLGSNISDIFKTINNTVTNPLDQTLFYADYFEFLDDAESFLSTTKALFYTQNNQDAYKSFVQGSALSFAASSAANITYETDQQQNEIVKIISSQFEKVSQLPFIKSDQSIVKIDSTRDLTSDFEATDPIVIYNELQKQKVAFLEVMTDKEIVTPKVATVKVTNESLTSLTYRYYGNLDNYNTIKDLNNLSQTSLLNGNYNILTE